MISTVSSLKTRTGFVHRASVPPRDEDLSSGAAHLASPSASFWLNYSGGASSPPTTTSISSSVKWARGGSTGSMSFHGGWAGPTREAQSPRTGLPVPDTCVPTKAVPMSSAQGPASWWNFPEKDRRPARRLSTSGVSRWKIGPHLPSSEGPK